LSWYFSILFFENACGASDKKIWGTLNTLPLGQSKQGKA